MAGFLVGFGAEEAGGIIDGMRELLDGGVMEGQKGNGFGMEFRLACS